MKKMKLSLAILMIQENYYKSKQNNVTKVLSLRNYFVKLIQGEKKSRIVNEYALRFPSG